MSINNTSKASFLALLLSTAATLAQANKNELIPYEKVDDNFYVLLSDGLGSNVGVNIVEDGVIVVDTMLAKANKKLMSTIKSISDKPVKFVINTHDHIDHTGNNKQFVELGATTLAYSDVSSNKQLNLATAHVASHSTSDLLVYFPKSNVLFMGDAFTNNWYPTFWTGGLEGQVKIIDKALELANKDTVVVPGHGFLTDINGLKHYKESSIRWVNRIMELHKKGLDTKQIAQDTKLNQMLEKFANGARPVASLENMIEHFINKTIEVELKLAQS